MDSFILNKHFESARNGSAEVVEYLVTRCGAPHRVEQKGQFEVRRTLTMTTCVTV